MVRVLLPAVVFLILVGFLFVGLYKDPSLVPSPLIGKPIPEFSLPSLKDPSVNITNVDLHGQAALINVWATWCVACKQEHGALVEIAQKEDIPIYGLNYKDESESAKTWLRNYGDPYAANLVDQDGRVAIDFGVYGAPETFLIDKHGVIQHKLVGVMTPAIWQTQFKPIIHKLNSMGN